jgi:hypothetical protein
MKIQIRDGKVHDAARHTPSTIAIRLAHAEEEAKRYRHLVRHILKNLNMSEVPLKVTEEGFVPYGPYFGAIPIPSNERHAKNWRTGEGKKGLSVEEKDIRATEHVGSITAPAHGRLHCNVSS